MRRVAPAYRVMVMGTRLRGDGLDEIKRCFALFAPPYGASLVIYL
jgi:hypothetical protein